MKKITRNINSYCCKKYRVVLRQPKKKIVAKSTESIAVTLSQKEKKNSYTQVATAYGTCLPRLGEITLNAKLTEKEIDFRRTIIWTIYMQVFYAT